MSGAYHRDRDRSRSDVLGFAKLLRSGSCRSLYMAFLLMRAEPARLFLLLLLFRLFLGPSIQDQSERRKGDQGTFVQIRTDSLTVQVLDVPHPTHPVP